MSNQQQNQANIQQTTFIYEPPTQQQYQYKIYVNDCDSYISSELIEQFRNDHVIEANPNVIIGSMRGGKGEGGENQGAEYPGVNHVIDITNQRLYNSVLMQADIILFTLHQKNIQQFEYILKFLKNAKLEKQIRLVCISSFLSWGKRSNSNHSIKVLRDSLHMRNSLNYHLKTLQDLCLAICHENEKVKGSVIFSGLVYGLGEDSLFSYFKRALEQEKPLQVYGKGTNVIPMIHLKDLSQIVYNVAFKAFQAKKNWHFACDSSKYTQRKLIQIISNNLGNGSVIQQPIQECFYKQNFDIMTLDLDVNDRETLNQWHSGQGLQKSIQTIVSQFNEYRGLKPNKILIIGPPVSGKSTAAQILKKNYGLPVITIKSLISDIKQDQTQFGKQIQTILQEIRVQKVQQERKAYQEMKKKKKGKGVEQFDADKVVARLPDDHLKRVINWRLNFSDCLNKGYILDSVIKTYKVAQDVFVNQEGVLNELILPNTVFYLKGTNEQIKQRVKQLAPQKVQNTHWNEEATTRRLQTYEKQNQQKSLSHFFKQKVDTKQVQFGQSNNPQVFIKFVQRNGPLGFKKQVQPKVQQPSDSNQKKQNLQKNSNQDQQQQQQQQNQNQEQIEQQFNLQKLTAKQQKILNQKSRPIRQYLIDNVIPQITEGLLEICKQVPQDPIDFLIGFLDSKSHKMNSKNLKRKK